MPTPDNDALHEDIGKGLGTDYLFLRGQLSDERWDYLTRTRPFVDEEVLPVIGGFRESWDWSAMG